MMQHTIITIGRQFGSGGHEVGNRLAERLDIPLYDHNLIHMAAQELRISNEDATKVDETILGRFLSAYAASSIEYRVFMNSDESGQTLTDRVFDRQCAIIRKLAEEGPGIFVGRCADFILRDRADLLKVFIHADPAFRADRIVRVYGEREDSPEKRIRDKDKRRMAYYRYYTDIDWGVAKNYDICLDSGTIGIDRCADIIFSLF